MEIKFLFFILIIVIAIICFTRSPSEQKCPLCGRKMKQSYKIHSYSRQGLATYKKYCPRCGYIGSDDWLAKK